MAEWIALGAATVEAGSADEAAEVAEYEELTWQVRYVLTAHEWAKTKRDDARPWLGKASYTIWAPLLGSEVVLRLTTNQGVWRTVGQLIPG